MDEHVFIIATKVHKILESKEEISAEMRMYLTGLLEAVLEGYKDKGPVIINPRKSLLNQLRINND